MWEGCSVYRSCNIIKYYQDILLLKAYVWYNADWRIFYNILLFSLQITGHVYIYGIYGINSCSLYTTISVCAHYGINFS